MSVSSDGSLASRAARQLGLDAAEVAGTGPHGSTTLADVLREAGRSPPAAARPSPPWRAARADAETGEGVRRIESACDAKAVREVCRSFAALDAEPPAALDIVVRLCATALREFPDLSGAVGEEGQGSRSGCVDLEVAGPVRTVPIRGVDEAGVGAIRDALGKDPPAPRGRSSGSPEAEDGVEPAATFVIRTPDAPAVPLPAPAGGNDRRGRAVLTIAEHSGSIRLELELDADSEEDGAAFLDRLRSLCLDPRRALL